MSITDELRKWAHGPDEGDDWLDRIDEFCDRIDAAHRSALEKLAAQVDESEDGWVRLPVDADGVPIRVGDVMENVIHPPTHREVTGVGVECFYAWEDGCGRYSQFDANCYRHYHAPTVEDVLREFAREIDADAYGITDAKVAEFAAKLQLREDS